jgi:hypothetical protein
MLWARFVGVVRQQCKLDAASEADDSQLDQAVLKIAALGYSPLTAASMRKHPMRRR